MQAVLPVFALPALEKLIDYAPPTVAPETTVWDTIALMNQSQPPVQRVLIVENRRVVGLFSWEDVLRVVKSEINLRNSKISEVMRTSVIKVKYSDFEYTKLILDIFAELKALPLIIEDKQEQLVGYITPEKISYFLLKEYNFKIREAEYIGNINQKIRSENLALEETKKNQTLEKLFFIQQALRLKIDESKQLEEDLKQALEKEKEINELKLRFISMTSHEFRTPLSTIISSSELLENYGNTWDEEKQLKDFNRSKKAVNHMINLLNDVLFFGKAEAGKLNCDPGKLDLVEYSRQIVQDLDINQIKNASEQQPDITIHFLTNNTTLIGLIDERTIGHILNNLLSNAIKYSNAGNAVKLTLSSHDKRAIFEIEDQGIGIPSEELSSLFDSFHRCKNVGNISGTGLGLSIVKKCVDMLQGEISVKSEIGVGTKFTVAIPLKSCC